MDAPAPAPHPASGDPAPGWLCALVEVLLHALLPERGERRAGRRHGLWRRRLPGGRVLHETTWVDGTREGSTTRWYLSGRKRFTGQWQAGKQSGEWFYFRRDGRLDAGRTGNYADGLRFSGIRGFNDWNT